jgi:hypothetical protein
MSGDGVDYYRVLRFVNTLGVDFDIARELDRFRHQGPTEFMKNLIGSGLNIME